jgi:hypothetical protein
MSSEQIYTFEQKEKLARRIGKLKTKEHFETIGDIITDCNEGISVTQNSNGSFVCFHNLTNETYIKIEKFILSIVKGKSISEADQSTYSSDYQPYSQDDYPFENNAKLRYNNRERNIIKRKLIDNKLNEISELETNDQKIEATIIKNEAIFVKKQKALKQ